MYYLRRNWQTQNLIEIDCHQSIWSDDMNEKYARQIRAIRYAIKELEKELPMADDARKQEIRVTLYDLKRAIVSVEAISAISEAIQWITR